MGFLTVIIIIICLSKIQTAKYGRVTRHIRPKTFRSFENQIKKGSYFLL